MAARTIGVPTSAARFSSRRAYRNDDIEQQRNVENNIQTRFLRGYDLNSRLPLRQHNNGFIRIPASICHEIWRAAPRIIQGLWDTGIIPGAILILVFGGMFWVHLFRPIGWLPRYPQTGLGI
ncbi:hypothetical protein GGTG_13400 [Gaeumannomyces tritici R3-111a-1]|uniref:Uncharacterized protein n=1 Tax=Gaeumannomyces tritici (strain R3-111a-1) TaxID=644352 RepID=J3PIS1_GAET3|nr:hypothetical protein GGTG_13400 [Gaeumannomyces tritici R3-111a-1]EJT69003.1 hypothetical protein GGTG_13400 [Gaeumannomyces tritici R3-111a-1]